jgi:hypothetical protein
MKRPIVRKPKTSQEIAEMISTGKGVRAAIRRAIKKARSNGR